MPGIVNARETSELDGPGTEWILYEELTALVLNHLDSFGLARVARVNKMFFKLACKSAKYQHQGPFLRAALELNTEVPMLVQTQASGFMFQGFRDHTLIRVVDSAQKTLFTSAPPPNTYMCTTSERGVAYVTDSALIFKSSTSQHQWRACLLGRHVIGVWIDRSTIFCLTKQHWGDAYHSNSKYVMSLFIYTDDVTGPETVLFNSANCCVNAWIPESMDVVHSTYINNALALVVSDVALGYFVAFVYTSESDIFAWSDNAPPSAHCTKVTFPSNYGHITSVVIGGDQLFVGTSWGNVYVSPITRRQPILRVRPNSATLWELGKVFGSNGRYDDGVYQPRYISVLTNRLAVLYTASRASQQTHIVVIYWLTETDAWKMQSFEFHTERHGVMGSHYTLNLCKHGVVVLSPSVFRMYTPMRSRHVLAVIGDCKD